MESDIEKLSLSPSSPLHLPLVPYDAVGFCVPPYAGTVAPVQAENVSVHIQYRIP